jgi:acyl carrier protein
MLPDVGDGRQTMASVHSTIREYLLADAMQGASENELSDDTNLVEEEILDSLGIFALVEFLEETFGIQIEPDEVVMPNFETVASIEALVTRLSPDSTT